jgi:hypothetical protein
MSGQSFMERFGPRLVANGYSILPIMPGTKKPGRFRSGAWEDYPDWTRHASRPTSEHELGVWRTWPDAGVGIACGTVVGIDIDIAEPELALELERLARDRLGDTPALRIGRAPKRLLVYRTEAPLPASAARRSRSSGSASSSSRTRSIPTLAGPMSGRRRASPTSMSVTCRLSTKPPSAPSSIPRSPSCRII